MCRRSILHENDWEVILSYLVVVVELLGITIVFITTWLLMARILEAIFGE